MSKKEEKPRSNYWTDRPLEKRLHESWLFWCRRIDQLESNWKRKGRPVWLEKMRKAKRQGNENGYELASLAITVKENNLIERKDIRAMIAEFAWMAIEVETQQIESRSLRSELQDLGVIRKQLKTTTETVQNREQLFQRIAELQASIEESRKKLLTYVTR